MGQGKRSEKESGEGAEQTRRTIAQAALRHFAGRRFEAVSLREIAREAGVAHNITRYHFRSKEGVWRAAVDSAAAEYVSSLQPVLDEAALHEDPEIAVAKIVRGVARRAVRPLNASSDVAEGA